jgi:PAS domain S-box-containing protein
MRPHEPRMARLPSWLARYGFAALTILAVELIMRIPVVGPELGVLAFLAFLLSASYGGVGPGLFSVVLFEAVTVITMLYAGVNWTWKLCLFLFNIFAIGSAFPLLVEALHAARRRVEAGRQWLSATLSSIGDAVIATDSRGRVLLMNPVAESLCGWTAAEAAGRPLDAVFRIINEQTRQPVESPAVRVIAEGVVVGLANHTLLIGRDGVERPIDDSGAPIRGPAGEVEGVVLVFRDVTERRRAEQRSAEEARRKDEFLAMLAHELRNPLAAVSNAAQLLALPNAEDAHEWSRQVIGRQVHQLSRMVDDLLDVSRISRGKIQLRPQRVDLAEVVHSAVQVVRPLIDERRHVVDVTTPSVPVEFEADPVRLEQVIVNLLNNAAKYTEPGGRIEIIAGLEAGRAVVRVIDTGIGIGPELLPRVFELFTQGDRALSRAEGGLGIGLTMVQKIAEMHGGGVGVSSDGPGRGSMFTVWLPVRPAPRPAWTAAGQPVTSLPP